jgi:mono/diheme cytochrome c family protein
MEVPMRWPVKSFSSAIVVLATVFVAVVAARGVGSSNAPADAVDRAAVAPADTAQASGDIVARGRSLVMGHACGLCHGGGANPAAKGWLAGSTGPDTEFKIGPPPCGTDPKATGCFTTRPRNLTPDDATGMGRFTERQLFNALRYGLRPEDTPDVTIASTTPGKANFPMRPHFLAPPMPWPAWRHMTDDELRAIAAYLKRGLKPVVNKVADSEGPPDFWASLMIPDNIGTHPAAAFPTTNEVEPPAKDRARVVRGRALVINHGCADCHQSPTGPAAKGWLAGITSPAEEFVIGPCFVDPKAPCFHGRPKNLTPDKETGIGKFTDQQIFNALRYGLRPEDTPDLAITSRTPGQGNFPKEPHYLGPFMPWESWRYMSDEELWSIIAYLRQLKPVTNKVALSDDLPDHWASAVAQLGAYPAAPFPTVNEIKK